MCWAEEEPLEKVEEFTEAIGIREFPVSLFPPVSLYGLSNKTLNPFCVLQHLTDLHLPDSELFPHPHLIFHSSHGLH